MCGSCVSLLVVKDDVRTVIYDRNQAELEDIRSNPDTYCTLPEGILSSDSGFNSCTYI